MEANGTGGVRWPLLAGDPGLAQHLMTEELRGGWLNVPRAYTLFDLLGAGLGAYMVYMGIRDRGDWQGRVAIGLGAVMIFIHTQRFFYAPQTAAGLSRLARAIDLDRADLARIAADLPPPPTELRP